MTKCNFCKKKTLIQYNCKCGGIYCITCRYDDKHNCQFNYIEHQKNELSNKLEKIIANKIEII
jgi:hypothetical protein